jgi:hypothetical protein
MNTIQTLGFGFLLPGLFSFACLALAARSDVRRRRDLLGALVFLPLPLWCFCLDVCPWRPAENWHWLPWLAITACLIHALPRTKWILWIFYTLFSVAAAWALVPDVERLAPERWIWLSAFPLVLLASFDSTIMLSRRLVGPAFPFYLLLCTGAAALLAFCASIASMAQAAGVLAGVVVGCCLASWRFPAKSLTSAIVPGWVVLYAGITIDARLYTWSEVPLVSFILVLLAPLMIWLTVLPPVRKMNAGRRTMLTGLLVMIPLAVGLYLAGQLAVEEVTEAEVPEPLLTFLKRLFGKSPAINMEE